MWRSRSLLIPGFVIGALACSEPGELDRAQHAAAADVGGSDDTADQECRVVLRSLNRRFTGNGYETQCDTEGCNWIWRGFVEVADSVEEATVHVLYRRSDNSDWWQVEAVPTSSVTPTYRRYEVELHEKLVGPASSDTEINQTRIELIPFLQLADGTRIFDHNRVSGVFDTYSMKRERGFNIQSDGSCTPTYGRVNLTSNWDEHLSGELRHGGYLVVDYDLERLPECRGTHNGLPAWDTRAFVKFSPGGEFIEGSMRAFQTDNGTPTNIAEEVSLVAEIPVGATEAQLWFKNFTGAGSSCETWDSNIDSNYRYEIKPAADDPRCLGNHLWFKKNSDVPYGSNSHCLDYYVDEQYAANHCELYLDGIGHGFVGHYGIPNRWVEATIKVGAVSGEVLGVGMFTRAREKNTGAVDERLTFGRQLSTDLWQTGLTTLRTSYMSAGFAYDIEAMAFFVDLRRPGGEVVRLWQSRDGANYDMGDAFSLPTSTEYIPYGNIQRAHTDAAIFDALHACD